MSFKKDKNTSFKKNYLPEIDGLRAFAVVAVIINHFNKELLPNGYLGVDIFFVISGFVITKSLYNKPFKNLKDFISGFYERRIKRLVPALSVFVLITGIAICLFNPTPHLSLKTGLTSMFGLSNLYLLKQSTDYFGQTTELNVFTHTWSLGVEEQFYIIFPFLIWFTGFGRQTKYGVRNLLFTFGSLTIASLVGFLYLYQVNQSAAYFLMPTRFWEMALGCQLFIGLKKRPSIKKFFEKIPPLLVLALIIGVMYSPNSLATTSTIAVVGLSLVLIASLKKGTTGYKFFTNSIVVYIGLISYSLYLWHWGILSISRWTIGIYWWTIPLQVFLIFTFAIASYRYIETPFRNGNRFVDRWKIFTIGGGLITIISSGLGFIMRSEPLMAQLYSGKKIKASDFYSHMDEILNFKGIFTGRQIIDCDTTVHGNNDVLAGGNKITDSFIKNCLSQKSEKPLVAFSGDSHSAYMFPVSEVVASTSKYDVFSHSKAGCIFPALGRTTKYGKCYEVQLSVADKILEEIRERNQGSVIVATSFLNSYFGYNGGLRFQFKKYPNGSRNSVNKNLLDFKDASKKLAKTLKDVNASLILVAPFPEHRNFSPALCSLQWFRPLIHKNCFKTDKASLQRERKHILEVLSSLEKEVDNIYIFDPFKKFCDKKYCYVKRENIYLYKDYNHISTDGAFIISRDIVKMINDINTYKNNQNN